MKNNTLGYNEARHLAITELQLLLDTKEMTLTKFCKSKNLNYQVMLNIRNTKKVLKYPKAVCALLKALNYKVTINKEITFDLKKIK